MVSMAHLHVISLAYLVTFQQASHLQVTVIDGHCYEQHAFSLVTLKAARLMLPMHLIMLNLVHIAYNIVRSSSSYGLIKRGSQILLYCFLKYLHTFKY